MSFEFTTTYDKRTMINMSRATQKTINGAKTFQTISVFIAVMFTVFLLRDISNPFNIGVFVIAYMPFFYFMFWYKMNAFLIYRKFGPITIKNIFTEENYTSDKNGGYFVMNYDDITDVCEDKTHFFLIYGNSAGLSLDKSSVSEDTLTEFRKFITGKTGKPIVEL